MNKKKLSKKKLRLKILTKNGHLRPGKKRHYFFVKEVI